MFRHFGKNRTLKHNLRIASLLSFVAGIVNVAGFLAVQQLTTNVTGHFAFFVEEIYQWNTWRGMVYFLFVFFFLLGSFTSGILLQFISKRDDHLVYLIPILIETIILSLVAAFSNQLMNHHPNFIAYALLFAMGLQNALVTLISNSVVRTTHLTGLFTDLGIELSQWVMGKNALQKKSLVSSIKLRLTIILFFFLGGICSALLYASLQLRVLYFAAAVLLLGLVYDQIKLKMRKIRRKYSKIHDA